MQITVGANVHAAAAAGGTALAALLRAAPQAHLERCSATARNLLCCFLHPFQLVQYIGDAPAAGPLATKYWQWVMAGPKALSAAVEALQACHSAGQDRRSDIALVGESLQFYVAFLHPANGERRRDVARAALLGSDSLQRYAMEALAAAAAAAGPGQPSCLQDAIQLSWKPIQVLSLFLGMAAAEGSMGDARMRTLLTHDGIIAPLWRAAEGRGDYVRTLSCSAMFLETAWVHFSTSQRSSGRLAEAHRAAQSAMMWAIRQGLALLQLSAVAPAQRQRAVRRARRGGFLLVRRSCSASD